MAESNYIRDIQSHWNYHFNIYLPFPIHQFSSTSSGFEGIVYCRATTPDTASLESLVNLIHACFCTEDAKVPRMKRKALDISPPAARRQC